MKLFNPAELFAQGAPTHGAPRASPAPRQKYPTRATHATVRGWRLVRKAAVSRFGRGKTQLEYRMGRWVTHVFDAHGRPVGVFLAYDSPTGVDFQPVRAAGER